MLSKVVALYSLTKTLWFAFRGANAQSMGCPSYCNGNCGLSTTCMTGQQRIMLSATVSMDAQLTHIRKTSQLTTGNKSAFFNRRESKAPAQVWMSSDIGRCVIVRVGNFVQNSLDHGGISDYSGHIQIVQLALTDKKEPQDVGTRCKNCSFPEIRV